MKNVYEFNIEDIKTVKIVTLTDEFKYTLVYTRTKVLHEDTFYLSHDALPDLTVDGEVSIICPKCGIWNKFSEEFYNSEEYKFTCSSGKCIDRFYDVISEDELIDVIMSYMDEGVFNELEITINDILIK